MAKHDSTTLVSATSRWDRPAVSTGTGETYLVVTLATGTPTTRINRPPVDVAFVIDRSGSMSGAPLALAKQGVLTALDLLTDQDGMSVVAYDDTPRTVCSLMPATASPSPRPRPDAAADGNRRLDQPLRRLATRLRASDAPRVRHARPSPPHDPAHRRPGQCRPDRSPADLLAGRPPAPIRSHDQHPRPRVAGSTRRSSPAWPKPAAATSPSSSTRRDLPAFFARELGEALSVVATGATLTLTLPEGVRGRLLNPFPASELASASRSLSAICPPA